MLRDETNDSRVWTSGGQQNALYGFYSSRYQNGSDRSSGTEQSEQHSYVGNGVKKLYGAFKWAHVDTVNQPDNYGFSAFSPIVTEPDWNSNDDLALIGKLREKFDQAGGFNGGNFMGELPQTVGLLGGKVGLLAGALAKLANVPKKEPQRYRRGKRVPPRKKPKSGDSLIANSWLEFSFGVLPLIEDIYALAEIASKQNEMRRRVVVRKRGRPGKYSSPWAYAECSGSIVYKKQLIVFLEQEQLPTFWEQFGLADPATILWELLPWSFVVDWVLPIGKFIEAQSFARRVKGTFVTTVFQKGEYSMSLNGATFHPSYALTELLREHGETWSVVRTVSTSLDVPLPTLKSSLLGGRPLERLANALSLMSQVLKSK